MKKRVRRNLIIFAVIILIILCIGIYFYQFHVFKTMKICISNQEQELNIACETNEECINMLMNPIGEIVPDENSGIPNFMKEKMIEVFYEAIYCDSTCKIREIYDPGFRYQELECQLGEKEIIYKIKGKELLKIRRFLKEDSGNNNF